MPIDLILGSMRPPDGSQHEVITSKNAMNSIMKRHAYHPLRGVAPFALMPNNMKS